MVQHDLPSREEKGSDDNSIHGGTTQPPAARNRLPPAIRSFSAGMEMSFKTSKRSEVHMSMQIAAKEAKFSDFFLKVRSILGEIGTGNAYGEVTYTPLVDEELLQVLGSAKSPRQFVDFLHRANLNAQQGGLMFRLLTAIRDATQNNSIEGDPEFEERINEEVERTQREILDLCTNNFLKGRRPVGENPIHVAFLFGLHQFGMAMIEAAAKTSENPEAVRRELIQRPYLNDLDPWFELARSEQNIKRPKRSKTFVQRASTAARIYPMGSHGRLDTEPNTEANDEFCEEDPGIDAEYEELVLRFKKLLFKHFPTAQKQREARMPYNLIDESGLNGRDGGLFTGETLLHLATVQHMDETVAWLLEHGAAIDARAGGVFFQPRQIETFGITGQKLSERSQWLSDAMALLFDTGSQREKNGFGGTCYYGEFPLSFAASVGDVHICHMIERKAHTLLIQAFQYLHDNKRAIDAEDVLQGQVNLDVPYATEFLANLYQELGESVEPEVGDEPVIGDDASENINSKAERLRHVFMNRSDARGNTALHMAVQHKRLSAIDFLLQNGARPSLRVLNENNLTPLTLAVRMGDTELFQHITSQLEINVWKFGSARMVVTPLEQIDTFLMCSSEEASNKPKRRKTSTTPTSLVESMKLTFKHGQDAAKDAAHKAKEAAELAAATAAHSTLDAAKGMGRLAKSTATGMTRGVKHATIGASHAIRSGAIVDLHAHKELLGKLKQQIEESSMRLTTVVKDGVKLFTKQDTGSRAVNEHDLHANTDFRCALRVVVEHEIDCFFDVPIFSYLIDLKWNKFAYRMHVRTVLTNLFFVAVTTFALDHRARAMRRQAFALKDSDGDTVRCFMFFSCPLESELPIQMAFDVCLYVLSIPYLVMQAWNHRRISILDLDPNGDLDWSADELFFFIYKNLTTTLSSLITAFLVGALSDRLRNGASHFFDADPVAGRPLTGSSFSELPCLSVVTLLMYCNLLHMLLPFERIGPVLITVWRMLMGDVTKWIIIYLFLLMGFGQAIMIAVQDAVMQNPELEESIEAGSTGLQIATSSLTTLDCLKYYMFVTLGDVSQPMVWQAGKDNGYIWILHVIFLILSTLLLLNLIIAMMGETYSREKTNEGLSMWWMMKAARTMHYERALSRKQQVMWRSGEDPFTSGQHRATVPFYRVELTEASNESDDYAGGTERRVHNLADLRRVMDARFHRVDSRQRTMLAQLEERQAIVMEKLEELHAAMRRTTSSSPCAQSPGDAWQQLHGAANCASYAARDTATMPSVCEMHDNYSDEDGMDSPGRQGSAAQGLPQAAQHGDDDDDVQDTLVSRHTLPTTCFKGSRNASLATAPPDCRESGVALHGEARQQLRCAGASGGAQESARLETQAWQQQDARGSGDEAGHAGAAEAGLAGDGCRNPGAAAAGRADKLDHHDQIIKGLALQASLPASASVYDSAISSACVPVSACISTAARASGVAGTRRLKPLPMRSISDSCLPE